MLTNGSTGSLGATLTRCFVARANGLTSLDLTYPQLTAIQLASITVPPR